MHTNLNFPAPLAALGFLAGLAGLIITVAALAILLLLRKFFWARRASLLLAAGAIVYFGLLFGFSLASREVNLPQGQEKYFCELDCHIAYSVSDVREERLDRERLVHVTVRTRFDETTISPQRPKDAPLTPSPRRVQLVDSRGQTFAPESKSGADFRRPLIPSESYETQLAFHVPENAGGLRLLIVTPGWEEHLIIGDESSFGHKKTYLDLPAAPKG